MASLAARKVRLFSQLAGAFQVKSSSVHTAAPVCQFIQAPVSKPKGRTSCTLIPGDGVGPELIDSVIEVFKAAGVPIDFERYFLSEVHPELSAPLDDVAASIAKNGIALKGILTTPDYSRTGELQTLNMKLRKKLDLYAHVVHVKSLPGSSRHQNVDTVVIREQTEGEYSALEHQTVKGVVECLKVVTRKNSQRIAKFAFDYATKHNRKKVTAVHKANIMKLGDGLFLRSCAEIAELYPKIQFESMIVDNCTMQFVSNPRQFDVCVMPNLYGNIITNLAAGLVGGAGLVAGASFSSKCVLFEPVRNSSLFFATSMFVIFLSAGGATHIRRGRGQKRGQPDSHAAGVGQFAFARQSAVLWGLGEECGRNGPQGGQGAHQRPRRPGHHQTVHDGRHQKPVTSLLPQ
ncbi:isocitrate dehydrogenase [NAD] subunit beta, mitochondrial-like isoform X1 [Neocloeon triangulifer]|uniref:isocitrate dehydrogenase [NAD] subunit beta, mitochondrial-like isoform X1 n=1 Tax=Neocloeon triangulifer TaxID=2078957 RepID=UPI00286F1FAF|nr:isocitrate dehydrogenase [NAD] subunit beta, mitochondrial-like isoform X1 [Neocloeon triangulifer]